jgi:uncharacterized protein YybS (DUF2232 family)
MRERGPAGTVKKELVLGVALSAMAFLTACTVSVFSTLAAIFAPLPILYYSLHYGRGTGLLILALSMGLTAAVLHFAGGQTSWGHLFFSGLLGVLLAEVLKRELSIGKTVAGTTLLVLGLGCAAIVAYGVSSGLGPLQATRAYIDRTLQEGLDLYLRMEGSPAEGEAFRSRIGDIGTAFFHLLPSLAFIGTAFTVFLNVIAGRFFSRRTGRPYPELGDLSRWRLSDFMIWPLLLAAGALLIPGEAVRWTAINVLIVFLFLYFLQGLSVVSFFFRKKNVPLFLRGAGYVLIFLHQIPLMVVCLFGITDVWLDFRKILKGPAPAA